MCYFAARDCDISLSHYDIVWHLNGTSRYLDDLQNIENPYIWTIRKSDLSHRISVK